MANLTGNAKVVAVIGDPIAHSRSPRMHNRAIDRLGLDMVYIPLRVPASRLSEAMDALRTLNFAGANITLPHKEAVIPFLDAVSEESRLIGAVNTIINREGKLFGTTTDTVGILGVLKKGKIDIKKACVTILGTGGSARTALFTLLLNGCRDIVVSGRHPKKAAKLVRDCEKQFGQKIPLLLIGSDPFIARMKETTLLINSTPAGMHPDTAGTPVDKEFLHRRMAVFDMVYNPLLTRLLREAKAKGAKTLSGIDMLIFQGMKSFELWTHRKPDYQAFKEGALAK